MNRNCLGRPQNYSTLFIFAFINLSKLFTFLKKIVSVVFLCSQKAKLKIRTHHFLVAICCYYSCFRFRVFFLLSEAVYYFLLTFQLYQHTKADIREVISVELERNKINFRLFLCSWNLLSFLLTFLNHFPYI